MQSTLKTFQKAEQIYVDARFNFAQQASVEIKAANFKGDVKFDRTENFQIVLTDITAEETIGLLAYLKGLERCPF